MSSASPVPPRPASLGLRVVLLATMAAWGANLSIVKWLLQTIEPLPTAQLRMVSAMLALLVYAAWRGHLWVRPTRRQWAQLAVCGLVMMYLNQMLLTLGVQRTAAANAALIIALNPLVAALLATALLGERFSAHRLTGVVVGFAGVAAVVLNRPGAQLVDGGWGDVLVFGAVVTWVGSGVLVQRLARELDTAVISTWVTTIGALLMTLHVALDPQSHWPAASVLTPMHLAMIGLSGLFAGAIGGLVWNHALRTLGVARTALYAYWVPIFGVLFAVTALGEPLTVWHAVGLAAVLSGTWLGTRR